MSKPRPVIVVPVWVSNVLWLLFFWAPIFAACAVLMYWLFFVPSISTRFVTCRTHEQFVELIDETEARRTLRKYENDKRDESRAYLESWCQ